MGELPVQNYLSPLTLESQLFLNSLETLNKTCNHIDPALCNTLEKVLMAIEKFLDKQPMPVVDSQITKFVPEKEMATIQKVYFCSVCKRDVGRTASKAAGHLINRHRLNNSKESRIEKRKVEREKREAVVLKLPKKAKALITQDIRKTLTDLMVAAEVLKTMPSYDSIENQLATLIKPHFPDKTIKFYRFGSRISGIGSCNSDLDIFIDIGNSFNTFENRASSQTLKYLNSVHDALRKSTKDWKGLCSIDSARVPIIKVRNSSTEIECDIGFSNSLGYCNTKLIEYIFSLQPVGRRMCIFFKKWLERSRLNEHVSTYSMTLMVIYFLQIKKHLPSIESLQTDIENKLFVGPWIANFMEKTMSELNLQPLNISQERELLKQFCQFYANFQYNVHVVCPYFGRPDIEIKTIESLLPERYADFVNGTENNAELQLKKHMIVQDPIQMNHNVTKSVSKAHLKEFKDYLKQSADVFNELK